MRPTVLHNGMYEFVLEQIFLYKLIKVEVVWTCYRNKLTLPHWVIFVPISNLYNAKFSEF